jgi:tagatose 6-phosphate kinase
MITTVTLNAAIDKAYTIDHLNRGEVMRVIKCSNTPGGKGLNVARVIKLCGEEVQATGFLGGYNGAKVEEMLREQQVLSNFSHTAAETRICINVLDNDGTSTEFLEPGELITKQEIDEFLTKFNQIIDKSDVITISGSVPKGINTDIYATMVAMVKDKEKKVILDTSGMLLKEGIKAGPTMIKPNKDEIEALLGVSLNNQDELIESAKQLQSIGIEMVVVSLGANGALLVKEDAIYHGKPPKITPVNTVGSGDSMVAAFAVSLKRDYKDEDALRYAIAVSAANTLTMTTGNFIKEDMEEIYRNVVIEKL